MKNIFYSLLAVVVLLVACKQQKELAGRTQMPHDVRVIMSTDSGDVTIRLYDATPLHRDNFIKLIKQGFYDSLLFHRVIPGFMVQTGDPESRRAKAGNMLGSGGDSFGRIPAEIRDTLINKRGALAAARDNNPNKESSATQFYVVTGKVYTAEELKAMQERRKFNLTPRQIEAYTTIGGAPWLDGAYTVFGEVETGMDVLERIGKMDRDVNDRPRTDVRIKEIKLIVKNEVRFRKRNRTK